MRPFIVTAASKVYPFQSSVYLNAIRIIRADMIPCLDLAQKMTGIRTHGTILQDNSAIQSAADSTTGVARIRLG